MTKPEQPTTPVPHVIVVEDEPHLREAICTYLNLDGFQADGVGSVQGFLAWESSHPNFDLAVLDFGLPDGNGLDLLKNHIDTNRVGTVMVSVRGELDNRLDGLSAGADSYLVKPVDFQELATTLRNIYRRVTKSREAMWSYNQIAWEITSPEGVAVRLTRSEASIIARLAVTPGTAVSRDDLVRCLGEDPVLYDPRRMEILVRRLRRKAEEKLGHPLPLETVHGLGFAFTALIKLI